MIKWDFILIDYTEDILNLRISFIVYKDVHTLFIRLFRKGSRYRLRFQKFPVDLLFDTRDPTYTLAFLTTSVSHQFEVDFRKLKFTNSVGWSFSVCIE